MLESEPALPASAQGFGANTRGLLASYDPDTCLWKTLQRSLFEEWEQSLEIWPTSGMTRNGIAYQLPRLALPIPEVEYSLWPTPTASQARDLDFSMEQAIKRLRRNQRNGFQTGPAGGSLTDRVIDECGGYPTAGFVELLMGFPLGWTDLED